MAANTTKTPVDPMQELVTVYIPKASGDENSLFVSLNGRTWMLPCGKHSEVPKPVAEIIYQREKALAAAEEFAEQEKKKMDIMFGAP